MEKENSDKIANSVLSHRWLAAEIQTKRNQISQVENNKLISMIHIALKDCNKLP